MKVCAGFHNLLILALAVALATPAGAVDPAQVDSLFARLAAAADVAAAGRVAAEIRLEWEKSGSAAIDYLYRRGTDALNAGDAMAAAEHFTAAIDHDPDFIAAWAGRARAYEMAGQTGPALADLAHALAAEPRQFDALAELGAILEETGHDDRARAAFQAALSINPAMTDARDAIAALSHDLDGQEI